MHNGLKEWVLGKMRTMLADMCKLTEKLVCPQSGSPYTVKQSSLAVFFFFEKQGVKQRSEWKMLYNTVMCYSMLKTYNYMHTLLPHETVL